MTNVEHSQSHIDIKPQVQRPLTIIMYLSYTVTRPISGQWATIMDSQGLNSQALNRMQCMLELEWTLYKFRHLVWKVKEQAIRK